jgi:ATP adenylyltransferase
VVSDNQLAVSIRDGFPVTPLHSLIIPKRHIADYFDLSTNERTACEALLLENRARLLAEDDSIRGFNIGVNIGAAAGQTIFHCHIHLIPRRVGDVEQPRGGIRHVIPGKGSY